VVGAPARRNDGAMTTTLAYQVTEADPVRRWRFDVLLRAGYGASDALVLSGRSDVDLHAATRMLRNGCPVDLAIRILL
jgi:hypothetical protein